MSGRRGPVRCDARPTRAAPAAVHATHRNHLSPRFAGASSMRRHQPLLQRVALALCATCIVLVLLGWGAVSVSHYLTTDGGREVDLRLARWLSHNFSGAHAWRNARDGTKTFSRLRALPRSHVLHMPAARDGKSNSGGSWIVMVDSFLSHADTQALISWAEAGRFRTTRMINGSVRHDKVYDTRVRNSSVAWCDWRRDATCGAPAARLLARLEAAIGIERDFVEPQLQVVRYHAGEYYREHMDTQVRAAPFWQRDAANPRILTAFVYLSDVPNGAGGETAFTRLRVSPVRPRRGRLLVWPNVQVDEPVMADKRMFHEARVLRSGVKYGMNVWLNLARPKVLKPRI